MSDRTKIILKEWIIPFVIELLIVLLLVKFVFFFVIVPTGSMIPTIDEQSYLFALRINNNYDKLKRGDIVVFKSDELGQLLVKRLVGMPGEQLVIDETGQVFIDGEPLDEPYVKNHSTQQANFIVPEDCYLFLGDNRSGSNDARSWSQPYINKEKIEGRAIFTIFPFSNFGKLE